MPPSRTNSVNTSDNLPPDGLKYRRGGVRATAEQIFELNTLFDETMRPTLEAREALAIRTGLFVSFPF